MNGVDLDVAGKGEVLGPVLSINQGKGGVQALGCRRKGKGKEKSRRREGEKREKDRDQQAGENKIPTNDTLDNVVGGLVEEAVGGRDLEVLSAEVDDHANVVGPHVLNVVLVRGDGGALLEVGLDQGDPKKGEDGGGEAKVKGAKVKEVKEANHTSSRRLR